MKREILSIILSFLFVISLHAQVAINTDGSSPDSSAILDIKSTSGGLLLPRMNTWQMKYISNPAAGLIVFNTDSMDFYGYKGSSWISLYNNSDTIHEWECFDPVVDIRDGKQYNTRLIGSQCWMAENLDYGTMITGSQTDNDIVEKYCYYNNSDNCNTYGGLYIWQEVMNYTSTEGGQGICPEGWHIPSDEELKTLEGNADTQYPTGNGIWNNIGWRGYDAGGRLKETGITNWNSPNAGATNVFGFYMLPGGVRYSASGYMYE